MADKIESRESVGRDVATAAAPQAKLTLTVLPRAGLVVQHTGAKLVREIVVHAVEDELQDVVIEVSTEPAFAEPVTIEVEYIPAGERYRKSAVELSLSPTFLSQQSERQRGRVVMEVRSAAGPAGRAVAEVDLLPPGHWPGGQMMPQFVAAWVRPNSPALPNVLRVAADRLEAMGEDRSLCGYQRRDPRHALKQVQAAWEALQSTGVSYISPPASFEDHGQKIRTHSEVVEGQQGTCLDLAVAQAALWEQIGLHPFLVVVEGHAFAGAWLTPFSLHEPSVDDALPVWKRVELGEAVVVDSSSVAQGVGFAHARAEAERMLRDDARFRFVVDVRTARDWQVLPLPGDGGTSVLARESRRAGAATSGVDTAALGRWVDDEPCDETVMGRLDRWKRRLLDLSLRNPLINFKERAKQTVDLPFATLDALEDALASGKAFRIEARPEIRVVEPGEVLDEAAKRQRRIETLRGDAAQKQQSGVLWSDHTAGALEPKLLELYRNSRTSLAEGGAVTLYLAMGMLHWFETVSSSTVRRAPLILVPVEMRRAKRGGQGWTVVAADEEPRVNVSLLQKLNADFGLDTSGLDVPPTDEAGLDVAMILRRFRQVIKNKDRWQVKDELWLARFSFTKFLMWMDLEANTDALMANPLVYQMFGGGGGTGSETRNLAATPGLVAPIVPENKLDSDVSPAASMSVMDADPSQLQAILAACDGSTFVLQGPPGTGKSQTITNMIAKLLEHGKTVLFVSEKMAALEVVHRRLSRVGLAPFCLELHSHKANRRNVVEQLKAPFALPQSPRPSRFEDHVRELQRVRTQLNEHADRLGMMTPFELPVRDVLSSLLGAEKTPVGDLPKVVLSWTTGDVQKRREAVRALAVALEDVGAISEHPWWGVRAHDWSPAWQDEVETGLATVRQTAPVLRRPLHDVVARLHLPDGYGNTAEQLETLYQITIALLDEGEVPAALMASSGFTDRMSTLEQWCDVGESLQAYESQLAERFSPALYELELRPLRRAFDKWAGAFVLFAWFMLWGPRRTLRNVLADGAALPPNSETPEWLTRAFSAQTLQTQVASWEKDGKRWLGRYWKGTNTDWKHVRSLVKWARGLRTQTMNLADERPTFDASRRVLALATDDGAMVTEGKVGGALRAFRDAYEAWSVAWDQLRQRLSLHVRAAFKTERPTVTQIQQWADSTSSQMERLRGWCDVAATGRRVHSLDLGIIMNMATKGMVGHDGLERMAEHVMRTAWWRAFVKEDPALAKFRGVHHAEVVREFHALEAEAISLAQGVTIAKLTDRIPNLRAPGDEMELLRRQMQLKRNHRPVRKLFQELGGVLLRIKPCVLMSPLSVAQYLDPTLPPFDVVVFDEASQIPPWDAVGAIARGKQAIIVGDTKQLPPTSFFSHNGEDELDDEAALEELESILEEGLAQGLPDLDLRWHYRSRHESLIAFSNHHYYQNRLHTFPSADDGGQRRGVTLHAVPDGFYDRGNSRTNRAEAEACVAETIRLLELPDNERPSIGIVTFSKVQQRLVEDLMDAAMARKPHLEAAARHGDEPLFIKNLENVQGDERDEMMFTVGYGPDAQGRVTMNFGALNRKGGERRLNVAITRAKERLVVFSTLKAEQLDLSRTAAVGVHHLKAFLEYAEHGPTTLGTELLTASALQFDSPFEEEVHAFLEDNGYRVHTQVGCSGYRIDLAIVHPARPGVYALAVECDGAMYHGSKTARARDRLRQVVLEQLGWRVHRVWSTDWWYESKATRKKLLRAVEDALADVSERQPRAGRSTSTPRAAKPSEDVASVKPAVTDVDALLAQGAAPLALPTSLESWKPLPHATKGPKDAFYEPRQRRIIARDVLRMVQCSGPVMADDVYRAIASAWGWAGLGKKIRAHIDASWSLLNPSQRPIQHAGVLWPAGMEPASWATFRPHREGDEMRAIKSIPTRELANASVWLVQQGVSMSRESCQRETAKMFGFSRFTTTVRSRVAEALAMACDEGRLSVQGDRVRLP